MACAFSTLLSCSALTHNLFTPPRLLATSPPRHRSRPSGRTPWSSPPTGDCASPRPARLLRRSERGSGRLQSCRRCAATPRAVHSLPLHSALCTLHSLSALAVYYACCRCAATLRTRRGWAHWSSPKGSSRRRSSQSEITRTLSLSSLPPYSPSLHSIPPYTQLPSPRGRQQVREQAGRRGELLRRLTGLGDQRDTGGARYPHPARIIFETHLASVSLTASRSRPLARPVMLTPTHTLVTPTRTPAHTHSHALAHPPPLGEIFKSLATSLDKAGNGALACAPGPR